MNNWCNPKFVTYYAEFEESGKNRVLFKEKVSRAVDTLQKNKGCDRI